MASPSVNPMNFTPFEYNYMRQLDRPSLSQNRHPPMGFDRNIDDTPAQFRHFE